MSVGGPEDDAVADGPGRPRDRQPDRLRELLDAVLDEEHHDLGAIAQGAHTSPYHLSRRVSAGAGEPPVALRRRVRLERSAWRLRGGASVTEVAWEAGYDSVEGFARAYARAWGHPPSATPRGQPHPTAHWLPAANGLHFHSPTSLWIERSTARRPTEPVTALMVRHDVADARDLLEAARGLDDAEWRRRRYPGLVLLSWIGTEESLAALLGGWVAGLEVWCAAVEGSVHPRTPSAQPSPEELLDRLARVGPRWVDLVDDIARRDSWDDRLVDALCEPPESFVLGSVVAHVLTYDAQRRGLARAALRLAGVLPETAGATGHEHDGDPIMWLRRGGGAAGARSRDA